MPPSMQEPSREEEDEEEQEMLLEQQPSSSTSSPPSWSMSSSAKDENNSRKKNLASSSTHAWTLSSTERPLGSSSSSSSSSSLLRRTIGSNNNHTTSTTIATPWSLFANTATTNATNDKTTTTSRPVCSSPPIQRRGVFDVEVVTEESLPFHRKELENHTTTTQPEDDVEKEDDSISLSSSSSSSDSLSDKDDDDDKSSPSRPPAKKPRLKCPPLVGSKYQVDDIPAAVDDPGLYRPGCPHRGGTCVWDPSRVTTAAWMWLDDRNIRNRGNIAAPIHVQVKRMEALVRHNYKWIPAQMHIETKERQEQERRAHYAMHSRVMEVTTATEKQSRQKGTKSNVATTSWRPNNRLQKKKTVLDASSSSMPLWDSTVWNNMSILRQRSSPSSSTARGGVISWGIPSFDIHRNIHIRRHHHHPTYDETDSDSSDENSYSSDNDSMEASSSQQQQQQQQQDAMDEIMVSSFPPSHAEGNDNSSSSSSVSSVVFLGSKNQGEESSDKGGVYFI